MSLDQAREFLARVLPWPQAGEAAWLDIFWTFEPKDLQPGRKLPWSGRAVSTMEAAVKAIEFATKSPSAKDIYCCMSSQSAAQETVSAKGWKYHKPVRLAENAIALKSLFLDLDAKGEDKNSYATPTDALRALNKFIADTGMPKPSVIVGSGGGFHIHWVFNRALKPLEWYPPAAALVEATLRHGLKCDTAVTTDAARVLRIPNTLNHKTLPPRPVKILGTPTDFDYLPEKLEKILAPYKVEGALPTHLIGFAPHLERRTPIKGESDLAAGIELFMPQDEVAACLAVIPNSVSDWNAWNTVGMRVFAACDGASYGLEAWRAWSDQLTTEGADSCEARWETLQTSPPSRTGAGALVNAARSANGDKNWTPRGALQASTSTLAGTLTSFPAPGAASPLTTVSVAVTADLPNGYTRDLAGMVFQVGLDDSGATTRSPVSEYTLTEPWLQRDPQTLYFSTITERGRHKQIELPLEVIGTNEMRKLLQSQGFMLRANPKQTMEFFLSWIKKLQESKDAVSSAPYGWNFVGGKNEGFAFAGQLYTPAGPIVSAMADRVLARQYMPTGDLTAWQDAVAMITSQGRPDIEAIVASAFAAPLVVFTGHRGLLMSAWSQESGIGKTTAMLVAQAVWGDPHRALQGLDDTQNSLFGKIGQLQNLPLYWDEIKGEEATKKFVNLTFRLSGGRDKSRMTQSTKLREIGVWNTILVAANNDSLIDYVVGQTNTTTAGLYRVFEFEVTPGTKGRIDSSTAARLVAKLDNNYGYAGETYAAFLGANCARVDADMAALQMEIGKEIDVQEGERLWHGMIGAVVQGATYANELGLAKFDVPALRAFMIATFMKLRAERSTQTVDMKVALNVSDKLAQFLNAMRQRHTIITNRVHISAGKPPKNTINVIGDASRLDGIYVHVGLEDKLLRISSTFLSEWLAEKRYSRHIFTKALADEFGCKKVHGRIASGTMFAGATEYLLEIQLAGHALADFIGEQ